MSAAAAALLDAAQRRQADDLGQRVAKAIAVWDGLSRPRMMGAPGARLGAIVENLIAAVQAAVAPSEWGQAGFATAESIESRCSAPSAAAAALLRLRPAIAGMGRAFRAHQLGTDAAGRGAGWSKTANTVEIAKAANDVHAAEDISGGELFRALKDIAVAAIQGGMDEPEWRGAAESIGALIRRRMVVS